MKHNINTNSNHHASDDNKLKNRHLQMIALGGVIGTGLFFGAAKSIASTGPSIILAYIIGGILMYVIMRALGEMTVYEPNTGSFSEYAHKYINNYAGFIAGWNAWFEYTIVCMVDLSALGFFLDYWHLGIPHWIICLIVLIIFTIINLMSIRFFGEFEFYFAGIKIVAIVMMLLFSAYLIFSKTQINPNLHEYLVLSNFFASGTMGFLFSLVIVLFSFGGTEFVSIAAADTQNPKKTIPQAINGVIIRIILFYILTIIAIICLYPYNHLSQNISPFVDVFNKIGITSAALIMNIVAITASLSAFNSCLYSSSRMLYNLSTNNNAIAKFGKLNRNGMPYIAVITTSIVIFIAVIVNYIWPEHALMYLLTVATAAIIITWFIILLSHLLFRAQYRHLLSSNRFKLYGYPYVNIVAIILLFIIMIIMTKMDDMKLSVYVTPIWILTLSIFFILRKINKGK